MRTRLSLAVAGLLALHAAPALAQGSVFGIRGLGWFGRPVSARAAGSAGALGMFDPEMNANPAALTRWRSVAAWAVTAPTHRSYDDPTTGSAAEQTMRFPVLGFAAQLPPKTVVGFTISDYLDRTWTLQTRDSVLLRGVMEKFTDAGRSIGGISDAQIGAGYRLSNTVFVGLGFHYYLGSTRLTAQRIYDNPVYLQILEQSQTDFHGMGIGGGLLWTLHHLDLSASGRLNGSIRSHNTTGSEVNTPMPNEVAAGLRWQAVPGVFLGGSFQYDTWGGANNVLSQTGQASKDVWSAAIGAEVQSVSILGLHTPLRLGARARTLPFLSLGNTINEHAASLGIGFNLGQDRTTIDAAFEVGSRSAGTAKESFQSLFLGLTVRP
jgi:hypothetical protein